MDSGDETELWRTLTRLERKIDAVGSAANGAVGIGWAVMVYLAARQIWDLSPGWGLLAAMAVFILIGSLGHHSLRRIGPKPRD